MQKLILFQPGREGGVVDREGDRDRRSNVKAPVDVWREIFQVTRFKGRFTRPIFAVRLSLNCGWNYCSQAYKRGEK
jgi:hypothetical protein